MTTKVSTGPALWRATGRPLRRWFPVLLLPVLAATAARPAWSAPPAATETKRPLQRAPILTLTLGLERGRDDNLLQLTSRNQDRLEERPGPPRFLIESADGAVNIVRGGLGWRSRPWRRRETRVELGLSVNDYPGNDAKNWRKYSLSASQELTASERHLTALELHGHFLPDYYLGQFTDSDESFDAGRRIRRSMDYAETGAGLRLRHERARGRLEITAGWERRHRDYNAHFNERDNDNDQWRVEVEGRPLRLRGLRVGLIYQAGRLDARGELASSPIPDSDISYDHHALGGSVMVPWGRGRSRGRVEVTWLPQTRTYTTANKYDITRFDRENHRRQISVQVTQRVSGPFELLAHYNGLTSDADFPAGVEISPDLTDFDQNRYGVMLRGRWDLISRH